MHRGDIPVNPTDYGCYTDSWRLLADLPSYYSALTLLSKECDKQDKGPKISGFNVMWVRYGNLYVYVCNYFRHR